MSIQKQCADFLRDYHRQLTSGKLGAGHAHELVAAFFGYKTAAALQAESAYPLDELEGADILIPDLRLMDERVKQLQGLPANLASIDDLAAQLCEFLVKDGHFSGEVWRTRDLEDSIDADFIQKNQMRIMDDLSDEMAATNATYDELYVEEVEVESDIDTLVATASGSLNGDNDPDKPFSGDKITFNAVITFMRVAGRTAFANPEIETSGAVDTSGYYDDVDA